MPSTRKGKIFRVRAERGRYGLVCGCGQRAAKELELDPYQRRAPAKDESPSRRSLSTDQTRRPTVTRALNKIHKSRQSWDGSLEKAGRQEMEKLCAGSRACLAVRSSLTPLIAVFASNSQVDAFRRDSRPRREAV